MKTLSRKQDRKDKKTAVKNRRTRTEKVKTQGERTEASKQIDRSIGADKQKYVEDIATTVEKAAREGNMKQLYDTRHKSDFDDARHSIQEE
ncbi:unnamed protein product [Schistosoma curassoni]|uniref:4F5 domain-containing protein n=1 Tax=Schistosoma curassoni TaxID=6186 RepID=A0A183JH30_9TREM|nr:unnamed protein product [Schistosoma curassoni]